ncbi:hypothetical protein [Nocardiopsis protaetiae]|uniref:hypothetical protein n=1 Tax=Nocardiopsis protaetiae TaxID=3382270 RepID=UPI00387B3CB8
MVITAEALNARIDKIVLTDSDQVLTTQTVGVASGIVLDLEPDAVYTYECLISYSAVSGANSALAYYWDVPPGCLFARYTAGYIAAPATTSVNVGADVIYRRPANTTLQLAGGTDSASPPANFHNSIDRGTITTAAAGGAATLMVRQSGSGSTSQTIVRGGNQTRCVYRRIA